MEDSTVSAIARALGHARKGGKTEVDFVVPSAVELAEYQGYLESLMRRDRTGAPANALPDGFVFETVASSCDVVMEDPKRRRGAAAVVVRTDDAAGLAVEVPHSFFDESTLPIALAVFEVARARTLIVNTVHRYRSTGGNPKDHSRFNDEDGRNAPASDVAHAPQSHFMSAHAAFVRTFPKGLALQVHGFRDSSIAGIDAVVSAARTSTSVDTLANRLRESLGLRIATYPKDTHQLGGTSNAQAGLSRKLGHRFIHIELSQSLRRRLVEDKTLLNHFASVVASEAR